ncbi:MAG TPA: molybdopterin biosynthesis protein MoeB [Erysipelotrichaceae bacterium]|nr:molybdopterin biosynthesis protein MoeB [Erysipelotrichaceae bacterium]
MFEQRYLRNQSTISLDEQAVLKASTVAVVGLGGLGGWASEYCARLGIGQLILIDYDRIEASNLNRQLFATESNIGMDKAVAAFERLNKVNSEVIYHFEKQCLNEENAVELLKDADIVIDALDSISSRRILFKACKALNVPCVHGSIGSWFGQVLFVDPKSNIMERLYQNNHEKGIEQNLGNPVFTASCIASIQVAETCKYLLGRESELKNRLLSIDLLNMEFITIDLEEAHG